MQYDYDEDGVVTLIEDPNDTSEITYTLPFEDDKVHTEPKQRIRSVQWAPDNVKRHVVEIQGPPSVHVKGLSMEPNSASSGGGGGSPGNSDNDSDRENDERRDNDQNAHNSLQMNRAISQLVSLGLKPYTGGLKQLFQFEENLERYCYANKISDRQKFLLLTVFLKGPAYRHFQKYLSKMEEQHREPTYKTLIESLKRKYMQPSDEFNLGHQIITVYQGKTERVEDYYERFEELAQHSKIDVPDKLAMHIFINGLLPQIAERIWDIPPRSLDQAVKRALTIENSRKMSRSSKFFTSSEGSDKEDSSDDSDVKVPKHRRKHSKSTEIKSNMQALKAQIASLHHDMLIAQTKNETSMSALSNQSADRAVATAQVATAPPPLPAQTTSAVDKPKCTQCGGEHLVQNCPSLNQNSNGNEGEKRKGKGGRGRGRPPIYLLGNQTHAVSLQPGMVPPFQLRPEMAYPYVQPTSLQPTQFIPVQNPPFPQQTVTPVQAAPISIPAAPQIRFPPVQPAQQATFQFVPAVPIKNQPQTQPKTVDPPSKNA